MRDCLFHRRETTALCRCRSPSHTGSVFHHVLRTQLSTLGLQFVRTPLLSPPPPVILLGFPRRPEPLGLFFKLGWPLVRSTVSCLMFSLAPLLASKRGSMEVLVGQKTDTLRPFPIPIHHKCCSPLSSIGHFCGAIGPSWPSTHDSGKSRSSPTGIV